MAILTGIWSWCSSFLIELDQVIVAMAFKGLTLFLVRLVAQLHEEEGWIFCKLRMGPDGRSLP
jgi:hypothetical protein